MKFTSTHSICTLCLSLLLTLTLSHSVHGQFLKNMFGDSTTEQKHPLGASVSEFGRDNGLGPSERRIQWPKLPSLFRPNTQSDVLGQGDLGSLSSMIEGNQNPGVTPPNYLDQINTKSKAIIDRTTDWAREKQQRLKENTIGRLNLGNGPLGFLGGLGATQPVQNPSSPTDLVDSSVTRSADPPVEKQPAPDYYAPRRSTAPTQPPIRTAANPDGQSTMRF